VIHAFRGLSLEFFGLNYAAMLEPLTNPQIRKFKAAAQLLEPMLKVGKAGLSEGFIKTVSDALAQHELIKIKFTDFKEQKKELAPQLAEKTGSHLVMRVGNVMVLHRPKQAATGAASA
jgi:RNA-binding protein